MSKNKQNMMHNWRRTDQYLMPSKKDEAEYAPDADINAENAVRTTKTV